MDSGTPMGSPIEDGIPPLPAAPPVSPGTAPTYRPRAAWPAVIGVIGCIFGAVGILFGAWAAVTPFFMDWMVANFPAGSVDMQAMRDFIPVQVAVAVISLIVAVGLLVGSIQLLKRQPKAAQTLRLWAACKIMVAVLSVAANYWMQMAQFQAMKTSNPGVAAMPGGMMTGILVLGVVLGLVWLVALPVFMLIWFSRRAVKEEMARW